MTDLVAPLVALVILCRGDGTSVYDSVSPETSRVFAIEPERRKALVEALATLGLSVLTGDGGTLSISGPPDTMRKLFDFAAGEGSEPQHAQRIPPEIRPFAVDVLIPPPPTFFP